MRCITYAPETCCLAGEDLWQYEKFSGKRFQSFFAADIASGRIAEVRRIFREICFEEKLINVDLKFAKNTRPFM